MEIVKCVVVDVFENEWYSGCQHPIKEKSFYTLLEIIETKERIILRGRYFIEKDIGNEVFLFFDGKKYMANKLDY